MIHIKSVTSTFSLFLVFSIILSGQSLNPIELGSVSWNRDLNIALAKAKKENKPVLILFQEVPGCVTCQRYGEVVLSHPLIVEAIETYFVPLAIYNNYGGNDAKVLTMFKEPSWNNPVVRIINVDSKDVAPRLSGNYSPSGLTGTIIHALEETGKLVPEFLRILYTELAGWERGVEKLTFGMYCFWTGEKELGNIPGVLYTEAGFMKGREVVNVYFDPDALRIMDLINNAKTASCADFLFSNKEDIKKVSKDVMENSKVMSTGQFRLDPDHKYYLKRSSFNHIPMTPLQTTLVNSYIGSGKDPDKVLSPQQINQLNSESPAKDEAGWKKVWDLFHISLERTKNGS